MDDMVHVTGGFRSRLLLLVSRLADVSVSGIRSVGSCSLRSLLRLRVAQEFACRVSCVSEALLATPCCDAVALCDSISTSKSVSDSGDPLTY